MISIMKIFQFFIIAELVYTLIVTEQCDAYILGIVALETILEKHRLCLNTDFKNRFTFLCFLKNN